MRYAIITPVKNEEKYIRYTLESVLNQTISPSIWLIVNDNSTDNTPAIIKEYLNKASFINLLDYQNNSKSSLGYGGIRAFNYGVQKINPSEYDFIVNLDGDVSFDKTYFEQLFEKFEKIPRLGIASGACWSYHFGRLIREREPEGHVPGPSKVYRKECYLDIHPIKEIPSWDTVDEIIAQKKGWLTNSFSDIRFIHHKPMALGAKNALKGKFIQGRASYLIGYPFYFMILRSIKAMLDYPYFIGGPLLLLGYISGLLSTNDIVVEDDIAEFLRQKQRERIYKLLFGKYIR